SAIPRMPSVAVKWDGLHHLFVIHSHMITRLIVVITHIVDFIPGRCRVCGIVDGDGVWVHRVRGFDTILTSGCPSIYNFITHYFSSSSASRPIICVPSDSSTLIFLGSNFSPTPSCAILNLSFL